MPVAETGHQLGQSVPATSARRPGVGRSHGREVHRRLDVAGVALRAGTPYSDVPSARSQIQTGSRPGRNGVDRRRREPVLHPALHGQRQVEAAEQLRRPPARREHQRAGVVAAPRRRHADAVIGRGPAGHRLVVPQLGATGRGRAAAAPSTALSGRTVPASGSHRPTTPSGGRRAGNRRVHLGAVEHLVRRRSQCRAVSRLPPKTRVCGSAEEQPAGAAQQRLAGVVRELGPQLVACGAAAARTPRPRSRPGARCGVSPWLAPSACAPGRGSRPSMRSPRAARWAAAELPKPPRPATTTSYVGTPRLLRDDVQPRAQPGQQVRVALDARPRCPAGGPTARASSSDGSPLTTASAGPGSRATLDGVRRSGCSRQMWSPVRTATVPRPGAVGADVLGLVGEEPVQHLVDAVDRQVVGRPG